MTMEYLNGAINICALLHNAQGVKASLQEVNGAEIVHIPNQEIGLLALAIGYCDAVCPAKKRGSCAGPKNTTDHGFSATLKTTIPPTPGVKGIVRK